MCISLLPNLPLFSFRPPKAPAAAVDQTRTSSAQPAAEEHIPKDFKLKVPIKTTSSDLVSRVIVGFWIMLLSMVDIASIYAVVRV